MTARIQQAMSVVASTERKSVAWLPLSARGSDEHTCRARLVRSFELVDSRLRACFERLCTGRSAWPLYLWGEVGSGKTRAALALCDKLEFARFWTLDDVVRSILGREAPWEAIWGLPGGPRLAVLDEIGTHLKVRDLEYDALKGFADWREDRPAIYIGNHPPANLDDLYDRRIESRLGCGTVFELKGPDRRLRK